MRADSPRMKAAYVDELGGAENIRYDDLPVPSPGPDDVLVRVDASAVNPVDTFVRSGAFRTPVPLPLVLGRDLVGVVVDTGARTSGFASGDRVWCNSLGHAGRQGAAAQYAVVPTDRLYRLPDGADPVEAVAVLHPGATAYLALATHARLQPGETVYVGGGAGHVGRAATVRAVRAGARVVASAGAADLDQCRALGAEIALDYRDPDLAYWLRRATPDGIDVHLDTSGKHDLVLAADLLAHRGRIVLMAGQTARPELPVGPLYVNDASLLGFVISNATTSELADAATAVNAMLLEGSLKPRSVQVLPLSAAAQAHQRLEDGAARGTRIVLRP